MKKYLLLVLLLSFSLSTFAKSFGVIITFDKAKEVKLKKLHKNYNTKIYYASKKLPKHVVVSKVDGLNYNEDYLKTLCGMYLEHKFIKKCELNVEIKNQQEGGLTCSDERNDSLILLRGLGSWFSGVSDSLKGCDITDPYKLGSIKSNGGNTRLVGGFRNYELSPLWAQEYIGADLAYQYMKRQNQHEIAQGKPPLNVKDGVIDTNFAESDINKYKVSPNAISRTKEAKATDKTDAATLHGSAVVSLMVDPKFGVSSVAELSMVKAAKWSSGMIEGLEEAMDNGTQIINMSTSTPIQVLDTLKEINKKNIIIVTAAGNDFDDGTEQVDAIYANYEQILVGSLAPQGYVSSFSQQGNAVTVLAPSDYWIQSIAGGKQQTFGGTSGSSPLVKGALDNVLAQVPGLTTKQLKKMIKNTAIEVVANETEGHWKYNNGVGMINAYKLAKVASKLRQMTENLKGDARTNHIEKLISSKELYSFERDAKQKYQSGTKLLKSDLCTDKIKGFGLIREAYFLNQDEGVRKKIVDIYEDNGRDVNAEFFKSITKDREKYIKEMPSSLFHKHIEHHPAREKK